MLGHDTRLTRVVVCRACTHLHGAVCNLHVYTGGFGNVIPSSSLYEYENVDNALLLMEFFLQISISYFEQFHLLFFYSRF